MEIKNSRNWVKFSQEQAFLGTCSLTLLAFAVRYLLHPYIEPFAVFHFFIVGCLLIQYLYGYKFSAFAICFSIGLGNYFFVAPYGTFDQVSHKDLIVSLNFAVVTGVAVAFMESLRRSVYARELMLKVMASRHKISLHRENDRIYYAKKTNEAWAILEELLTDFDRIILIKFGESDYKLEPLLYKLATCFQIQNSTEKWPQAFAPEDMPVLTAHLDGDASPTQDQVTFSVGFCQAPNLFERHDVCVERFSFMGKSLSVLKLA